MIPESRLFPKNDAPVREDGDFVLYWMMAERRTRSNFGLERAIAEARRLDRPLLVLEALSCSYRWASDRFHQFVLEGMRDNARACAEAGVAYHPYVEPEKGAGRGLHAALGEHACLVVTDEWPCFELPRWVERVASASPVRVEAVDSCGLLPLRSAGKPYGRAFDMRRHVQRVARECFDEFPQDEPLADHGTPKLAELPRTLTKDWPATDLAGVDLSELPIDHGVAPVAHQPGGAVAAHERLASFIRDRLPLYGERNEPSVAAASGLSPHLHWGHISTHEVLRAVAEREDWEPGTLDGAPSNGKREGFWGMSPEAEGFVDELVTWREICFNTTFHRTDDYDAYESLPEFARETLALHERDERPHLYSLAELDAAETDDEVWNAAQRQLVRDGVIHNYLRMLWGKRVLTWTRDAREALAVLIELNNKYSLDGRDPNSYGGIFWTLGRYDRGWPEREVFGKVRCMTSDSARRKLDLSEYLREYGGARQASLFDS